MLALQALYRNFDAASSCVRPPGQQHVCRPSRCRAGVSCTSCTARLLGQICVLLHCQRTTLGRLRLPAPGSGAGLLQLGHAGTPCRCAVVWAPTCLARTGQEPGADDRLRRRLPGNPEHHPEPVLSRTRTARHLEAQEAAACAAKRMQRVQGMPGMHGPSCGRIARAMRPHGRAFWVGSAWEGGWIKSIAALNMWGTRACLVRASLQERIDLHSRMAGWLNIEVRLPC